MKRLFFLIFLGVLVSDASAQEFLRMEREVARRIGILTASLKECTNRNLPVMSKDGWDKTVVAIWGSMPNRKFFGAALTDGLLVGARDFPKDNVADFCVKIAREAHELKAQYGPQSEGEEKYTAQMLTALAAESECKTVVIDQKEARKMATYLDIDEALALKLIQHPEGQRTWEQQRKQLLAHPNFCQEVLELFGDHGVLWPGLLKRR